MLDKMTESSKTTSGRRMKARAPPPPQVPQPAPRRIFRNMGPDQGRTLCMDTKENMLRATVDLQLTLPEGYQTYITEDGRKALMDLLVELCSRYHLSPALHTLELLSPEGHPLRFKPNGLLGSLNVACVLIKEKVCEEKVVRRPAPKVPEKTIRLMVNYHGSQKAVVRVDPLVPLEAQIPVICEKCEFDSTRVVLLNDNVSRHKLPLDKNLVQLGIKELYVFDQSLDLISSSTTRLASVESKGVLRHFQFSKRKSKLAEMGMTLQAQGWAIAEAEERISKAETSSSVTKKTLPCLLKEQHKLRQKVTDLESRSRRNNIRIFGVPEDAKGDLLIKSTGPWTYEDAQAAALELKAWRIPITIAREEPGSSMEERGLSTVPSIEDQPSTLGQSQSVMNVSRVSDRLDAKKRRAPAPPGAVSSIVEHNSLASYQICRGSDSQERKRKAPAPPPTPASITPGPDDTTTSAAPNPDSHVTQSARVSANTAITQILKPTPLKIAVQPPNVPTSAQTPSSPTPSSSTTDSLAVQDSCSELSHNLDYSDLDSDETMSRCNTLTSSTGSESAQVKPTTKSSRSRMEESEKVVHVAAELKPETTSATVLRSETELALNLKRDEVENNRNSAMGVCPCVWAWKRIMPQVQQLVELDFIVVPWLHSVQWSNNHSQTPEAEQGITPEEETLSLSSSSNSSGSSLPDQGCAASEGTAEEDDSGIVNSPSDNQPKAPDGNLFLNRSNGMDGVRMPGPAQNSTTDSDDGCATWGSKDRHADIKPHKSDKFKDCYKENPNFTAGFHPTPANFEATIANAASPKWTSLMSKDVNVVPMSVMYVPVTAIDEVLEEYETKLFTRMESSYSKGPNNVAEPQNENNNACVVANSNSSGSKNTKNLSQPEQQRMSLENKCIHDKKEGKTLEIEIKKMTVSDTKKEDKQIMSLVKSNIKAQRHSKIKPDPAKSDESKHVVPPMSERLVSSERDETQKVFQNSFSSTNPSHCKMSHNVTFRCGMKTFTVVPCKPSIMQAASGKSAVALTAGVIKIDEQGNILKSGINLNKAGSSSESGIHCSEEFLLMEKAKDFGRSNERQESAVPHSKGWIDIEGTKELKTTHTASSENTLNLKALKTFSTLNNPAEKGKPEETVQKYVQKPGKYVKVAREEQVEVESKISVSKNVQQPSTRSAISPPPFQDLKKDLPFLKPPRRTSSQYVASAINKYTPKTSAKPSSMPSIPKASASLQTLNNSFHRICQTIEVNPRQSSQTSLLGNKENRSESNPPDHKKSMSYPDNRSEIQRDSEEAKEGKGQFGNCVGFTKGNSNTPERATTQNKHILYGNPAQINMTNGVRDMKSIQGSSTNLSQSSPPFQSSDKSCADIKTELQGQKSNVSDMPKTVTHLTPEEKPSLSVTDRGVLPGPLSVTVFGPVKKFRPVSCRSVEKETSLHGNLMEAIQTGKGRNQLKKISTSGPSSMKKASHFEEENERSALLAAIRAQSNCGRLRKTKCEAADELQKFRMATFEEERSTDLPAPASHSSLTCISPVCNASPQPTVAPPLPPSPVLPQTKPGPVAHPSANTLTSPALTREAMLEAIRSGSAAQKLKKGAVPMRTIQVNGRMGTVQAASSTLPQL
ncbi:protein cordon-bleu [Aulostomus maculatus]